jgi:hypothetical protein
MFVADQWQRLWHPFRWDSMRALIKQKALIPPSPQGPGPVFQNSQVLHGIPSRIDAQGSGEYR